MIKERYEIWDAYVKFEDDPNTVQKHPVMIWNDNVYICTGFKITSTNRGDNDKELRIVHWEESGLDHESSIRLGKLVKLEEKDFIRKRGKLDDRDRLKFDLRHSRL